MLRTRGSVVSVRRRVRGIPLDGRAQLSWSVAFLSGGQHQSSPIVVFGNTVADGRQRERLGVGCHSDRARGGKYGVSPSSPDLGVLRVLSRAFVGTPWHSIGVVLMY